MLDFFPKLLYGDDDMIVLENLVVEDTFVMLDKEKKQDLFTAKLVLEHLAQFHGASYAFIEDFGGGWAKFKEDWELVSSESFLLEGNPMLEGMFDNGLSTCINILKGHPVEGDADAIQSLAGLIGKTYPIVQQILKGQSSNKMNVLNHGDCWNNNMLFKLDPETGKVSDHIFVDLQITRLGSPNLDLGYFLYTSVQGDVRRAHLMELLQHYFDNLAKALAMFGRQCPLSFEEFVEDYKYYCQLGYFVNLTFMSAIGAFKDIDHSQMTENMEEMMAIFSNAIDKWVKANPEKARIISSELAAVIKEHGKLREE